MRIRERGTTIRPIEKRGGRPELTVLVNQVDNLLGAGHAADHRTRGGTFGPREADVGSGPLAAEGVHGPEGAQKTEGVVATKRAQADLGHDDAPLPSGWACSSWLRWWSASLRTAPRYASW